MWCPRVTDEKTEALRGRVGSEMAEPGLQSPDLPPSIWDILLTVPSSNTPPQPAPSLFPLTSRFLSFMAYVSICNYRIGWLSPGL